MYHGIGQGCWIQMNSATAVARACGHAVATAHVELMLLTQQHMRQMQLNM